MNMSFSNIISFPCHFYPVHHLHKLFLEQDEQTLYSNYGHPQLSTDTLQVSASKTEDYWNILHLLNKNIALQTLGKIAKVLNCYFNCITSMTHCSTLSLHG